MDITFQGNKPLKNTYPFAVREDNNSNKITFVLDKIQGDLDLSFLSVYVKVQGSNLDKDIATKEVEEDKINVVWTLLRKHSKSRVLKVQLQFEGTNDIVWQSEIITLINSDTIKADEYIKNEYPAVLTNHEGRIITLEEHSIDPSDYYDKEETNELLDQKQNKLTFDNVPTENSNNPVKSGGVYASLQTVIEIAEGKSQSFTLSCETEGNEAFDSEDSSIELASFTDINGNVIDTTKLKVGDIILITQLEVPDRWVGNIQNGVATFYRMETTKVDLTAYYTKAESDQKFVNKTNDEVISGQKTFDNGLIVRSEENQTNDFLITGDNTTELIFQDTRDGSTAYIDLYRLVGEKKELALRDDITTALTNYATKDYFGFKVIEAPTSTTLTNEEFAELTNGKPHLIIGTFLNYKNALWLYSGENNYNYVFQLVGNNTEIYTTQTSAIISKTTKVAQIVNDRTLRIRNLQFLNDKLFPNYQTDTTKQYKLVQQVGGTLAFSEDKEEIIIKLDTGTYTSGTPMSDNDYNQLAFLLNLTFEEVIELNLKFAKTDVSRNETQTTTNYQVRKSGTSLAGSWYDIQINFGGFGSITLAPQKIANKTW